MSNYRKEANDFAKDSSWTFWRFLPLLIIIVFVLGVVGFGLNSAGLLGGTVVERKVFENSYQRSESIKARIATDEAALVEIEGLLKNPKLEESTRYNLKAQAAAARSRINTARRMK